MTDKPTPTDAELKAMWQLHAADIGASLTSPAQPLPKQKEITNDKTRSTETHAPY